MQQIKHLGGKIVLKVPRFPPSQTRAYKQNELVLDGVERMAAFKDLTNRVNAKQECWSWQIQSLVYMINIEGNCGRTTPLEATNLMKACQADIIDLFPSDQKILTEIAWDSVKSANMEGSRLTASLYTNMILAYTFQDLEIDDNALIAHMKQQRHPPNHSTYAALLEYLCKEGEMEKALEYLEERSEKNLPVTESVVKSLILGHAGLGQIGEGEKLLKLLNERNIYWGKGCYRAFVLGCAKSGDVEATNFFLNKHGNISDDLVLKALQEMNKNYPERIGFLMKKLPINVEHYSSICRRTVKVLIEKENVESAWEIVRKSRDCKENNSDKERVIKISPSVIVLREFISKCEDMNLIFEKMDGLKEVDPKIVSRTVIILLNLCFEDETKIPFSRNLIQQIVLKNPVEEALIRNYVGQNSKRRMFKAANDEEVYLVFEIFTRLGLKLDKIRAWDVMMKKLVSSVPNDDEKWTYSSLLERVHEVKSVLSTHSNENKGLYSHSLIWGHILQHLLNREQAIFFVSAAKLCVDLNVAFAPKRWHLSLANCLIKLNDAKSYVEIMEVSYKNSIRKDDFSDFHLVASSLVTAIVRGFRWKIEIGKIDKLISEVLDEIWRRGIKLPPQVRADMIDKLHEKELYKLSSAVENIPVLGSQTFKQGRQSKTVRIIE